MQQNEPGTLKYEINRELRPGKDGNEDIVMIERYAEFGKLHRMRPCPILRYDMDALQECANELLRYKDQHSLRIHGTSERFGAFQKQLSKEGLMRAPMLLKMVSEKGGFASRL